MRPEGTRIGRPVSWPVLTALALVPLLMVVSLLALLRGDDAQITAAIVNLDEGTEIEGTFVPMGRQLAAEMIEREGTNITWILADEESGEDGLITGEYAAVVTIPANFSAAAMSYAANDAAQAEQATIEITVSQNAPVTDAALAQEIAHLATESLNNFLTSQYLENIYLGFNTFGDQFSEILDGVTQLHDGASQLADGAVEAGDGAGQLADGAAELAAGSDALRSGGDELAAGSRDLASGSSALAEGVGQLNAGVQEMAGQMPQLVDGVGQLVDGAEQLLPGVAGFADGTVQALDGVGQLQGGIDQMVAGMDAAEMDFSDLDQLATGSSRLAEGSQELADGIDQLYEGLQPLDGVVTDEMLEGVSQVQDGLAGLGGVLRDADRELQDYASGAAAPPAEVLAVAEDLKARFECTEDPAMCDELRQLYEDAVDEAILGGFQAGAGAASEALNSMEPESGLSYLDLAEQLGTEISGELGPVTELMEQAQELVPGIEMLRDGSQELADGNRQLADGIDQLVTQLPVELEGQLGQLRGGLQQLSDGAGELVTQTRPLVDAAPQLADGSNQLLGGIRELGSQIGGLPTGVRQLADGTAQLSSGAAELSEGIDLFSGGVVAYVDGVWLYTGGVDQVADGVGELADGLVELGDGASQLEEGLGEFASQLGEGAEELPYYSDSDRERLSEVVASPVAGGDGMIESGRGAMTSLVLVAGCWLAGLAAFVVVRPVPSNIVTSNAPNVLVWGRTLWLPTAIVAGVGLLMGLVGGVLLALSAGTIVGLMAFMALLGVVFALTQHALAAWWGHIGRGVALVLLAVTLALGLSSAVPEPLTYAASVSPLHSGMLLVRSWIAGADVVAAGGIALFVGVVMGLVSFAAVATRRQMTAAQFRRRHG